MNRELFEVRGNSLVIHVPEELDHHNAEPIRQGADQILEKQQVIKTDRNLFDINVGSCLFIL